MLRWFGKKKASRRIVAPDAVYMHRAVADEALLRTAEASDLPVIVTSFFPTSLSRIEFLLNERDAAVRVLVEDALPTYDELDECIWTLRADRAVSAGDAVGEWLRGLRRECLFLFVEHFPILREEGAVLDLLEDLADKVMQRAIFFTGVDEPVMKVFGGERLVTLMESLGIDPSGRINHSIVDKALLNARRKIGNRVQHPLPADSDIEWCELNLKMPGGPVDSLTQSRKK